MAYAVHKMPQIGEVSPGMWLASAFGGQGINTTAMAGMLVARGLVDGDDTWRLFAPYELIWAGGLCGRAAVQLAYGAHRVSEAIAMRNAARREAERSDGAGTARALKEQTRAAAVAASASDRQATPRGEPRLGATKQRKAGEERSLKHSAQG